MLILRRMHFGFQEYRQTLRDPGLTALLALQLFVLFGIEPLALLGFDINAETVGLLVTILVAAIVLVSPGRGPMLFALVSLALSAAGALMRLANPSLLTYWLGACGGILALLAVSWVVGGAVFGPGRVTTHRIMGAVVLYLNVALIFTALYRLIAELAPGSFSGLPVALDRKRLVGNLVYFSVSTLTTTGFGDMVPVNPLARSLANLEAVIGQLYPATFLARIVTLHVAAGDKE